MPRIGNNVDIWLCHVGYPTEQIKKLEQILAIKERMKAESFHFDECSRRFIISRAILRIILSKYTCTPPMNLIFHYGPQGKPKVNCSNSSPAVGFSISHSGDYVVYAVTTGFEVGIDIEQIRRIIGMDDIIMHFFSVHERDLLLSMPTEEAKVRTFLTYWTRKEAYLKGSGEGLSNAIREIGGSVTHDECGSLLSIAGDEHEASRWCFYDVKVARGYVASLAVAGQNQQISYHSQEELASLLDISLRVLG